MTVYPIKCVLCPDIPNNEGAYLPITMTAPEGTIVNSRRPAAVGSRQILGHCIANVVLAALGQVEPERILAECGSPSPRIVFSGQMQDGRRYNAADAAVRRHGRPILARRALGGPVSVEPGHDLGGGDRGEHAAAVPQARAAVRARGAQGGSVAGSGSRRSSSCARTARVWCRS